MGGSVEERRQFGEGRLASEGGRRRIVDHREARLCAKRKPEASDGSPIERQRHAPAGRLTGEIAAIAERRLVVPGGEHEPAAIDARLVEERQRREERLGECLGATADADVGAVDPQADAYGAGHSMKRALRDDMRRNGHRPAVTEADERAGSGWPAGAARRGNDGEAIGRCG